MLTYANKEHPMSDPTPEAVADQEIQITRIFDAPRRQVFRAWTDPAQVAAWYGPGHVEVPRDGVHIDLRVGGRYEITMLQPGGGKFAIGYEIIELEEPALIVLRSDPMPQMGMPEGALLRIELHELADKTRMTLTDGPYPAHGHGMAETGWNTAFDKLAQHLVS